MPLKNMSNHFILGSIKFISFSILGSMLAVAIEIWPELKVFYVLLLLIALFFALIFFVQIRGLFNGRVWANSLNIHQLTLGMEQYVAVLTFFVIGILLVIL